MHDGVLEAERQHHVATGRAEVEDEVAGLEVGSVDGRRLGPLGERVVHEVHADGLPGVEREAAAVEAVGTVGEGDVRVADLAQGGVEHDEAARVGLGPHGVEGGAVDRGHAGRGQVGERAAGVVMAEPGGLGHHLVLHQALVRRRRRRWPARWPARGSSPGRRAARRGVDGCGDRPAARR